METRDLLDALGYIGSAHCLTGQALRFAPDFGHIFRRAADGPAGLEAVYCLRPSERDATAADLIPISYVCRAGSFEDADEVHRLVWNQNVVPFLVVLAPQGIRAYTGFDREERPGKRQHLLLAPDLSDPAARLASLPAAPLDSR